MCWLVIVVAAGYAMRVDGEQDTHGVPGAGGDLGGRGAGGQILGWDRTPGLLIDYLVS